jgi:septum formation protein
MRLLKPIVLASKSPRRVALLRQIGIQPIVAPSHIAETFDTHRSANENAVALALSKAREVAPQFSDAIIVGADTIVVVDGEFIAKPDDEADAKRMLRLLSGRTHTVVTGFALVDRVSGECLADAESTDVTFRHLPNEEIDEYVAGGSPMDKAGAYGIQDDYAAVFVTRIEGCYYNVMGFPLAKFYMALQKFQTHLMEQMYVEKN